MSDGGGFGNADVRRRLTIVALVLAVLGTASFALSALQRNSAVDRGSLTIAGNVRPETFTVRAPAIAAPQASGQPTVSGLIAEVYAAEGDLVTRDQPLARLDTALLDLGVKQAEAVAAKARADVAVLSDALDTIGSSQTGLARAKRDLRNALARVRTQRADLAAQLKRLESMPAPPSGSTPPTGSAPPGTPMPNPAALIAKLKAGLAKIDAAIAKMESGLAQMATGSNKLADAKTQAANGRELLVLVADARDVATALAQARRDSAVITAPADGLVTFARRAGTVAMVNAPLFRIAPSGPVLVDTYLTTEQLGRVHPGDVAEITYDSGANRVLRGTVSGIGAMSTFPPTSFPTDIVHMTRTTRVTITLVDGARPPAGTPVDITIRTRSRD